MRVGQHCALRGDCFAEGSPVGPVVLYWVLAGLGAWGLIGAAWVIWRLFGDRDPDSRRFDTVSRDWRSVARSPRQQAGQRC
jgi:hypothetical protein